MHLPAIHSDAWGINYTRDAVSHGDTLYYAPEGTVHAVTNVSRSLMALRNLSNNSTWTVERDDVTDSLYTDFFPVGLSLSLPNSIHAAKDRERQPKMMNEVRADGSRAALTESWQAINKR